MAILMVVVLWWGLLGISCSSSDDVVEEPTDTSQNADPPEGRLPSLGLSDDLLTGVAERLGIAQQALEDAFAQAQSEMAGMFGEGQLPGNHTNGEPPEGMSPEGTPPGDTPPQGMSPGSGWPDESLAQVAEILGIDQQELADALAEARGEMPAGAAFPNHEQQ